MSLLWVHARATLAAASDPANRAKALALVLSVGFSLFCVSLMFGELRSTHSAPTAMETLFFALLLGLSMMTLPLWRGLIWGSKGPAALPIRPRAAAAVEGGVFALLTLIPLGILWGSAWLAVGDAIPRDDPSLRSTVLVQAVFTGALFLCSAPMAAQLRSRTASNTMWGLFALPGLAGVILSAGLTTRQSSSLYITLSLLSVFASVLVIVGAFRFARYATNRLRRDAGPRPGRLDRLAVDSQRDLLRSVALTVVLSLLGWCVLRKAVVYPLEGMWFSFLQSGWSGLVILPLIPRLTLISSRLGIRLTDTPDPTAWSILPVHPTDLRRRLLMRTTAPLTVGLLVDIGFVSLLSDPHGLQSSVATVNVAASVLCMLVLGGAVLVRLPRSLKAG